MRTASHNRLGIYEGLTWELNDSDGSLLTSANAWAGHNPVSATLSATVARRDGSTARSFVGSRRCLKTCTLLQPGRQLATACQYQEYRTYLG